MLVAVKDKIEIHPLQLTFDDSAAANYRNVRPRVGIAVQFYLFGEGVEVVMEHGYANSAARRFLFLK